MTVASLLILIPLLPLFGFLTLKLFGRFLGKHNSLAITIVYVGISLFLASTLFYLQVLQGRVIIQTTFFFISLGDLEIPLGFLLDPFSSIFSILILFITLLILIFSISYMGSDPEIVNFFSYLSFFCSTMLLLVLANNFVICFLGWEGVGLASYLLINFWTTRNFANQAAMKAIVFNRIGDVFFILALALIYMLFHSFDYGVINTMVPLVAEKKITLFFCSINLIELLSFCLFVAAMAKSAQLLLHPWLPDAMEGPTPVSALLHSATMVTAGVFLILRSSCIFAYAPSVSLGMVYIGLATSIFSSLIGLVQFDIKKVIAFSTCSQLGFLVLAAGLGNFAAVIFHLVNHAFFKACLFLCAGSVIHAIDHQDIRKMGGLLNFLPITYVAMSFCSLSLAGFPFLSGFYSKDAILQSVFSLYSSHSFPVYLLSSFAAFITSFYSFRLIYYIFLAKPKFERYKLATLLETDFLCYTPIIILTLLSLSSGYFLKDLFLDASFWKSSLFFSPLKNHFFDLEMIPLIFKLLPSLFSFLGLFFAFLFYGLLIKSQSFAYISSSFYKRVYSFFILLNKKFFVDSIYNHFIFSNFAHFALDFSYKTLDKGFFEKFGPVGIYKFITQLASFIFTLEEDFIYSALVCFVAGSLTGLMTDNMSSIYLEFISLYYIINYNELSSDETLKKVFDVNSDFIKK